MIIKLDKMNWNFLKRKENRSSTNIEPLSFIEQSDPLLFGKLRNEYSSMNLPTVFRCVDLISDSVAMLPIKNFNYTFGNQTKYEFMKLMVQSVLLKGNAFALIQKGNSLRFINSSDVQIHYDKIAPSTLYYTCNLIPNKKILPSELIHLKKFSFDGVNGKSVIDYAIRTIKVAHASENSALGIFENGCNLAGVLSVEGQVSKEQRKQIKVDWQNSMDNGGNGLAILQGNMKYQPVQMNATDAQLLESRLFQSEDICRFFGVNPVMVGDLSKSSYGTLEAAQQEFLLHTLQPYIQMIEEEFERKLNQVIDLDETYILRTDKQQLASYYTALVSNGIMTINEVRKELGYPDVEGGDDVRIPFTDTNQNKINQEEDNGENSSKKQD